LKVTLIASTAAYDVPESVEGTKFEEFWDILSIGGNEHASADDLAHFAGRSCYQAWNMPNPATSNNLGYLNNILQQGHESVLEHASATFYIEGVSRSLLTELTRHRHVSFSVESQRYVDYSGTEPVYPPACDASEKYVILGLYQDALDSYDALFQSLRGRGLSLKQAREAARSVLPNCAPVAIAVTGNMRAFRDVLKKRYSVHADAEIFELAKELLRQLKDIAPASFQDFEEIS
jgi:thymidylate synthase (FAD)